MNPRQRRGVLLMGLAVIGGLAVFLAVANYVGEVRREVGPLVTAYALQGRVDAFQPITGDLIAAVELPERWAPPGTVTDPSAISGLVAGTALPSGTLLQDGMLLSAPDLEAGQRELAIMVDAETGVAGKIGPGSIVDIYASLAGTDFQPPQTLIIVQNAEVIDVGVVTQEADPQTLEPQAVVPVTFALSVEESLQLAYVETFAAAVRLGLRAPGDREELGEEQRRYQPFEIPDQAPAPTEES